MRCHGILVIFIHLVEINCRSLPSERNVTKPDLSVEDDLFPDWVPFKNKHGDELGEFVPVEKPKKSRLKKRLARPKSFILSSFADADDYFEKGPESEGAEYFDKGDWLNNFKEDLSVQGIVTSTPQIDTTISTTVGTKTSDYIDEDEEAPPSTKQPARKSGVTKFRPLDDVRHKSILDNLGKEEAMQLEQRLRDIEDLQKDNIDKYGRKKHTKDFVDYDELILGKDFVAKDKYAPKRKQPTSTTETETIEYTTPSNNQEISTKESERTEKISVFKNPRIYMMYDDDSSSEPPSVIPLIEKTTTPAKATITVTTEAYVPARNQDNKIKYARESSTESVRISLVPLDNQLKEDEPTLFFPQKITTRHRHTHRKHKESAQSQEAENSKKETDDSSKTDELFKATTDKYVEPIKDTSGADSSIYKSLTAPSASAKDQSSEANTADLGEADETILTAPSASGPDFYSTDTTRPNQSNESQETRSKEPSSKESNENASKDDDLKESSETVDPSGSETTEGVVDLTVQSLDESQNVDQEKDRLTAEPETGNSELAEPVPASTHEHHEKKPEHQESERGGMREHHADRHSEHGESSKKGYSGTHKDTKEEKGHHDKEDHIGSYHDHGGHDERHHDEKKHHGSHKHQEHGKKHAEYEESGKHSKGHSTKGSHDIHKKEEYEKKVEFFEEEGDSEEEEKHGGHKEQHKHNKGGNFKHDNSQSGDHKFSKGDSRGFHQHGHNNALAGRIRVTAADFHAKKQAANRGKHHHNGGRKWIYHHASPSQTANLVVIDRRKDQDYHGPQYYGTTKESVVHFTSGTFHEGEEEAEASIQNAQRRVCSLSYKPKRHKMYAFASAPPPTAACGG